MQTCWRIDLTSIAFFQVVFGRFSRILFRMFCLVISQNYVRWSVMLLFYIGISYPAGAQWELDSIGSGIEGYTNFLGQGLSFVDFNLDGWDDLTVPNASGEVDFHIGGPEGFTEVDLGITTSTGNPMSVMWIDIDNDGDRDFLHTSSIQVSLDIAPSTFSRSQIWINEEGDFVDRTEEWGWDVLEDRACFGVAFHDMDGDGDLDGMVSNYALPCSDAWLTENVLFEHKDSTFMDVSVASGIANGLTPTFQSVWMHLNGDDWIDLFVINDAGVNFGCDPTNEAYLNNGDGTFTEASALLGLDVSMSSMSSTVGDPDADGEEEVFVTNQSMEPYYTYPQVTSAFFDRDTTGVFEEASTAVGLALDRWSWSAMWVDADLDGWDDLMVATYPFHLPGDGMDTEFYENYWMQHPGAGFNTGEAAYSDYPMEWPGEYAPLFCLVRGDLDQDGDPDMVGLGTGQFLTVWDNAREESHPDHDGLTVSVCGTHSNSEAIGTKMVLHTGGHRQQRTLRAGEDLFVQHSTTQFFGLGESTMADSLEVFWPDGARTVRYALQGDSAYRLVQAEEEVAIVLGEEVGDSITLNLSLPPKWTGVEWNGEATSQTSKVVAVGDPVSGRALWFGGLYSVDFEVDWSALSESASGCTVSIADNYDPQAETDDGSCTYHSLCGEGTEWSAIQQQCIPTGVACPEDLDGDDLVGVTDVLLILSMYGESCAAETE